MKNKFKSYHTPSDDDFSKLWKECLFVVDTNVLLNLYRYSDNTRDELLKILVSLKDRLWLPFQTGSEFYRSRIKVILDQHSAYDRLLSELDKFEQGLKKSLDDGFSKHSSIDSTSIKEAFTETIDKLRKEINQKKENHPDLLKNDGTLEQITGIFDGKVGDPFTEEDLKEIYKKGEIRFKEKIAPGYEDNNKEGNSKYGDYVIWSEIIAKAKQTNLPIIFITDDRKEDWWLRVSGKTIGPRPELIEEIKKEANVDFYMYQSDPFLEYAAKFLERKDDANKIGDAIKEIRNIRKDDEIKSSGLFGYLGEAEEYHKILGSNLFEKEYWYDKYGLGKVNFPEFYDQITGPVFSIPEYDQLTKDAKLRSILGDPYYQDYLRTKQILEKDNIKLNDLKEAALGSNSLINRRRKLAEALRNHEEKKSPKEEDKE